MLRKTHRRRVCVRYRTTTPPSPTAKSSSVCWVRRRGPCSPNCAAHVRPAALPACSMKCWAISGSCVAIPICRTICSTIRSAAMHWSKRSTTGSVKSIVGARPTRKSQTVRRHKRAAPMWPRCYSWLKRPSVILLPSFVRQKPCVAALCVCWVVTLKKTISVLMGSRVCRM